MAKFPASAEDFSLIEWWENHPRRGWLVAEVGIGRSGPGDWPNSTSHRRLDAVHFPDHPTVDISLWQRALPLFAEAAAARDIEIVEAKDRLTLDVVGQCIAGADMFSRAFPAHGLLTQVAVVRGRPDAALSWVCNIRGIAVAVVPEDVVRQRKAAAAQD